MGEDRIETGERKERSETEKQKLGRERERIATRIWK